MATSAPLAAAAAASGSAPGSYVTFACGARASNGLERRGGEPDLLQPPRLPLARRHDGVAADGIDLGRAAAGDHAHICVGADDCNRLDRCGVQRQHAAVVLQQDNSTFFDLARGLESRERIDNEAVARIIDDSGGKHGTQDAVHVLVELGLRNCSRFNGGLELVAEEVPAGLFIVQSGCGSFFSGVRSAPVREHKAGELPLRLQHLVHQPVVFAGVSSVHLVVAAHDRGGMALLDADLEGQQVGLMRGALVDDGVDAVARGFLVVEGVMLDVADDVLGLGALNEPRHQVSGQDGVLAEVLEGAPIARFAGDVHAAAEGHVVALRAQFRADQLAVFVGGVRIPACRRGLVGGQRRGVAPVHAARPHAVGRVAHVDARNPQPRHAHHVAHAAVRRGILRRYRLIGGHALAVQQRDLLLERHLLHHQVGALVRRQRGVHPRTGGRGLPPLRPTQTGHAQQRATCRHWQKETQNSRTCFHLDPRELNRLIWTLPFNYAAMAPGKRELAPFTKIMIAAGRLTWLSADSEQ